MYHPEKANVVADVLRRKSMGSLTDVQSDKKELVREIYQLASFGVRLADSGDTGISVREIAESSIMEEVKQRRFDSLILVQYRDTTLDKEKTQFEVSPDGYSYTKADYVYRMLQGYGSKSWAKHIMLGIMFTLVPLKCTMILEIVPGRTGDSDES